MGQLQGEICGRHCIGAASMHVKVCTQAALRGRVVAILRCIGDIRTIVDVIMMTRVVVGTVIVQAMGTVLMLVESRQRGAIAVQAAGHENGGDHQETQGLASQTAHNKRKTRRFAVGQADLPLYLYA
ncbi:hypothetical protein [Hyphomicrobium sp. CS1GBMeth3]|uniref:hypothetical protein n=1 Tax=Hyphomicrobium sp. CS1GBMeth3 TaxID=1892845 RepID=UPI0015C58287|nr:hypothetical protein [Hyphomicrobium sp. CS1GBMeth3]